MASQLPVRRCPARPHVRAPRDDDEPSVHITDRQLRWSPQRARRASPLTGLYSSASAKGSSKAPPPAVATGCMSDRLCRALQCLESGAARWPGLLTPGHHLQSLVGPSLRVSRAAVLQPCLRSRGAAAARSAEASDDNKGSCWARLRERTRQHTPIATVAADGCGCVGQRPVRAGRETPPAARRPSPRCLHPARAPTSGGL